MDDNTLFERYQQLRTEQEDVRLRLRHLREELNSLRIEVMTEIGGGVSADAQRIKLNRDFTQEKVDEVENLYEEAATEPAENSPMGSRIKTEDVAAPLNDPIDHQFLELLGKRANLVKRTFLEQANGSWSVLIDAHASTTEKKYDALGRQLEVRQFLGGASSSALVGSWEGENVIVFRKLPLTDKIREKEHGGWQQAVISFFFGGGEERTRPSSLQSMITVYFWLLSARLFAGRRRRRLPAP